MSTGTDNPGKDNVPGGTGNKDDVTFSSEQQTVINNIIQERLNRAKQSHETALGDMKKTIEDLQTELTAYKEQQTKNDGKGGTVTVEDLQRKIDEMLRAQEPLKREVESLRTQAQQKEEAVRSAQNETIGVRKRYAITEAASEANFLDLEAVYALTEQYVQWDETTKKFVVKSEDGQERLNSAFKPMSLKEFYEEYASKKPYLVRADMKGGTGSTHSQHSGLAGGNKYTVEQVFGPKSSGALAQKLKKENAAEYARLKALAKEGGLLS